ncbi:MAG: hypothetical protein ACK5PS_17935 [Desulfopila sp.]
MKIQCPQCGVRGTLADAHAGKMIKCPKCQSRFLAAAVSQPLAEDVAVAEGRVEGLSVADETPSPAPMEPDFAETAASQPMADGPSPEPAASPPLVQPLEEQRQHVAMPPDLFDASFFLRRSWQLTRGVKMPIWIGIVILYGISFALAGITAMLIDTLGLGESLVVVYLLDIVSSALTMVPTAGLLYMGVRRATGRTVVWGNVLAGLPIAGRIMVAGILQITMIMIGFCLLVLPGIYLTIGYMMALPLMVDRGMGPWQAMETSRKAIHKVWWRFFGLYLLFSLVLFLSALFLGVGLIWTAPMAVVLSGVLYVHLFGGNEENGGERR